MRQLSWVPVFAVLAMLAFAGRAAEPEYASHGMAGASPSEVYLEYARVIHAADSAEAILPFSPQPVAQARASMAGMSPDQMQQALAFMRSLVPLHPEVLEEIVDGETATLQVRGDLPGMIGGELEPNRGTVTLVLRGGEWKISDQSFEQEN